MNISDEYLRKIVKEVVGEDPFWNIPVYDVVRKIIDLPQGADFGIGDLINTDYNISTMSPKMQKDIYDSVIEVCKKISIDLLETSPEIRMNEHSFTWALTKKNDHINSMINSFNESIIKEIATELFENLGMKYNEFDLYRIDDINATHVMPHNDNNERYRGGSIIIGDDGTHLVCGSIHPLDYYIEEFKNGKRDTKVEKIKVNDDMNENKYRFYKDKITNKTWWVDNRGVKGEMLFTFDKKKIYNLFRDYPYELSSEEIDVFDKENPYWADFFKDRKQSSEDTELEKVTEDIDYEKRKIDEYIEKQKNEAEENQRKLESIKKLFFENNESFFDEIKMYLNETLDYDILNNPSDNCLRFEVFNKKNNKKMFFAINNNLFVLNDLSDHKLNLRGNSSNEIFSSLISRLEDITKEWNLCYSNVGEYFWGITICNNSKCNLFVGNSSFPNNWSQFIDIINHLINDLINKTNDEVKRIYLNQTEE